MICSEKDYADSNGCSSETSLRLVAILCASRNSIYKTMPCVDVFDAKRNARTFNGGMPVVAHPPCRAWSAFCSHQAKPLPGEKELGLWCCEQLRGCGGVLEHPAHSRLFSEANLPLPGDGIVDGLWSMRVNQSWWGDSRTKNTWLCFSKIDPASISIPFRLHSRYGDRRRWQVMSKHQRSATNSSFAEWLIDVARKANS